MRNSHQEIITLNPQYSNAVFFGAGVSFNSGIPTVPGIIDNIFNRFSLPQDELKIFNDSGMPFEAFMDILANGSDIDKLIDIFTIGSPNQFHFLMAELARAKYINVFVTTNFDQHLESAFIQKGIDFDVFYKNNDFDRINWLDQKTKIIKLHGCISDRANIAMILNNVAQKKLNEGRAHILNYLFKEGSHKKVSFFGYSCSDLFDITPYIENLGVSDHETKEIIFIDHTPGMGFEFEDVKIKADKNPFKYFEGIRLIGNTDSFLQDYSKDVVGFKFVNDKPLYDATISWDSKIDEWWEAACINKYFILGSLYANISQFAISEKYYKLYFESAVNNKDKTLLISAYSVMISSLTNNYRLDEALIYIDKALALSEKISDISALVGLLINVGQYHVFAATYQDGIDHLLRAKKILIDIDGIYDNDKRLDMYSRVLSHLGTCYYGVSENEKAYNCYTQSLQHSETTGDLYSQVTAYRGLGMISVKIGKYSDAKNYAEKAEKLARNIGIKHFIGATLQDSGKIYYDLNNYDEAFALYTDAHKIFCDLKMDTDRYVALGNIGMVYHKQKKYQSAEEKYLIAISHLDGERKITCQLNAALLYSDTGKHTKALKIFDDLIVVAKKNNDLSTLRIAYLNKGVAYSELEDDENGKLFFNESLQVAYKIGDRVGIGRALFNLGMSEYNLGNKSKAKAHMISGHESFESIFGINHAESLSMKDLIEKLDFDVDYKYYTEPCQLCISRRKSGCGWCTDEDTRGNREGTVKIPKGGLGYPYHKSPHERRKYYDKNNAHIPLLDGKKPKE